MEGLLNCSLSSLEHIYQDRCSLSRVLDSPQFLQDLAQKYNLQSVPSSFGEFLNLGSTSIDNLQVEYARLDLLNQYSLVVKQGANAWVKSAVVAGPNVSKYLFELFTNSNRTVLLGGYAAIRYKTLYPEGTMPMEEYIIKQSQINTSDVIEALAIGAVVREDLTALELYKGVSRDKILLASVAAGSVNVFSKYKNPMSIELFRKALVVAVKAESFAILKSLLSMKAVSEEDKRYLSTLTENKSLIEWLTT